MLPLILLGSSIYLLLYVHRLWEGISELPAFLPDGRSIDKAASSWLVVGLVRGHFVQLKDIPSAFTKVQARISVLLIWWTVPLTLFGLWLRGLSRHDVLLTSWHLIIMVSSIFCARLFYNAGVKTLRAEGQVELGRIAGPFPLLGMLFGVFMSYVMFGTRYDENPLFARLVEPLYANFENQSLVLGANLSNSNLRYANGRYATMVRVDLRGSDLRGAHFNGADLTGANFQDANLQEADLREAEGLTEKQLKVAKNYVLAYHNPDFLKRLGLPIDHNQRIASKNLSNVKLPEANLHGADLKWFNVQGADLRKIKGLTRVQLEVAKNWPLASYSQEQGVSLGFPRDHNAHLAKKDLRGYPLQGANLRGAELEGFNLEDANLQGADLREAKGLTKERLQGTRNWVLALYSEDLLTALGLPVDHDDRVARKDLGGYSVRGANLRGAQFTGFKLQGADFQEANLRDADFEGAELWWTNLIRANLQGANFLGVQGLIRTGCSLTDGLWLFLKCLVIDPRSEFLEAKNWILAYYREDLLSILGLPSDHNERLRAENLSGYVLHDVNLEGADLTDITGLNWDQLNSALTDDMTQFPKYLQSSKPGGR